MFIGDEIGSVLDEPDVSNHPLVGVSERAVVDEIETHPNEGRRGSGLVNELKRAAHAEVQGQPAAPIKIRQEVLPVTPNFNDFFIPPAKFRETYAADVPAPEAQFLAASQQQLAEKALGARVSAAAWRTKPSYAILTTQDHVISPELQRWMYQRSGTKVTEVSASHAVFASQPVAVARVIEAAAK